MSIHVCVDYTVSGMPFQKVVATLKRENRPCKDVKGEPFVIRTSTSV